MAVKQNDTEPVPNLPLLRKVLDHIDAHPDEWYQGFWFATSQCLVEQGLQVPACGTAYCIAGHAVVMTEGLKRGKPSSGEPWGDAARRHLGLTPDESRGLFFHANTRETVQTVAERIAARAGEVL